MNWLLPVGEPLHCNGLEEPLQIVRGLGGGTQGQVYAVESNGEALALKWYLPSCIKRDPRLRERLQQSIRLGAPNSDFLWPLALVEPSPQSIGQLRCQQPGFGYLMPLRPHGFVGAHLHAGGQLEINLQQLLRACFLLSDGFHQLHLKGLCYKDISLGNLFLEPERGAILICDNDNVDIDGQQPGSVLGTPGFMAPEVLLGKQRPSANSDLFSLAVLLFRLLTRHDPFRGARELAIRCLDEPARRRLYGEEALFIFNPNDASNRPDPAEHAAALITWPIYPPALQALFVQTFVAGLHEPTQRSLTGQWSRAIARCLDQRQICQQCGQETFPEPSSPQRCWNCGTRPEPGWTLRVPRGEVAATAGNELHPHHFDPTLSEDLRQPLARVVAHPSDPRIVGLQNLSTQSWQAELSNGERLAVEPQKTCNLAALRRLHTEAGAVMALHR